VERRVENLIVEFATAIKRHTNLISRNETTADIKNYMEKI
jgi:hypothetical protein